MRTFYPFPVTDIEAFKLQLLDISNQVKYFCYLDSNNYPNYPYSTFGSFFAIDAIDFISVNENCLATLEQFQHKHQDWLFGFFNYDLKNEIEPDLQTNNAESSLRDSTEKHKDSAYKSSTFRAESLEEDSAIKLDNLQNPLLHFFIPKYLVKIEDGKVEIGVKNKKSLEEFRFILQNPKSTLNSTKQKPITIIHRLSNKDYIQTINKIKQHIQRGDIYEMNFCQEFYAENASINPVDVFIKLNQISKAPFSSFFKNEENYLMCASPERFLKRQNNTLISQPIKGTRKRIKDKKQDNFIKQQLFFDEKERSENVMIVDLVRNDFSKIAIKNTVEVEELFGIYTFKQVHQMISTITCNIPQNISVSDIMRAVFPMGSMTGAPKISAMQLIEQYEPTKRGLFSGAVGYITPKGNFDFNVVIRSIFYNTTKKYISIQAGSAITIDCDAEKEYDECLLKAKAMFEALK